MAEPRFTVVGGGLAGLMTVIKLCEAGHKVDLLSIVPVKRSHSVCAQGGINGAVNTKGEGDHPDIHVKDTLRGGDFLAEQTSVRGMCYAAPGIIYLLDRMGVPFNRTAEGLARLPSLRRDAPPPDRVRRRHHRPAAALRARRAGAPLRGRRAWSPSTSTGSGWGWCKDESGRVVGSVAMDLRTMEIRALPAEAVMLATGGPGIVFGRSTNSIINTGTAAGRAYLEGAIYANGEFIQVHPTAIPGEDKLRLMSESVRGEGGRVWVPKTKNDTRDPLQHPRGRALVLPRGEVPQVQEPGPPRRRHPRDLPRLPRAGHGHRGPRRRLPRRHAHPGHTLDAKIKGVMEIYEKFVGDDPRRHPMVIFPAHALLDGRPVGDLRGRGRTSSRWRTARRTRPPTSPASMPPARRLRVPRRQPARRQLAALLHLRRDDRRAGHGELREEQRQEPGRGAGEGLRRREEGLGRTVRRHQQDDREREPLRSGPRAGRGDDRERHRRPAATTGSARRWRSSTS